MELKAAKFKYDGSRQARRVLPGHKIEFNWRGSTVRDVVESIFLFGPDNLIFNTVTGFRIPTHWSTRYEVWVKED